MATEQPIEAADVIAAGKRLQDADDIEDPALVLELILNAGDSLPLKAMVELWRGAAKQAALADLAVATGEHRHQSSAEAWHHAQDAFRSSLSSVTDPGLDKALTDFVGATRALVAFPALEPRARRLESALELQQVILGFHWDDKDNSYRRSETELNSLIAAPITPDDVRLKTAKELLEQRNRYRQVFIPRLVDASTQLEDADRACAPLMAFFSKGQFPDVWRWHDLTRVVIAARKTALDHVAVTLDWDCLTSTEVIEGRLRKREVDGKPTLVISEESTALLKEYAVTIRASLEAGEKARQIEPERQSALKEIFPKDPAPSDTTPGAGSTPIPPPSVIQKSHPIQRTVAYRIGKLVWIFGLLIWCGLSLMIAPDAGSAVTAMIVGAGLFYGMRMLVFYVWLGRPTLRERPGSGFVDLDEFEEELLGRSVSTDQLTELKNLRLRHGRRVPADVVRGWINVGLETARNNKQRLMADLDNKGSTIKIASLRQGMLSSRPTTADPDSYRALCERTLLKLEVEYGAEVPVSVVSKLADSFEAQSN
jgi:hypothetical protein